MARTSWYAKQIEAEKARIAQMIARYAAMSERELVSAPVSYTHLTLPTT